MTFQRPKSQTHFDFFLRGQTRGIEKPNPEGYFDTFFLKRIHDCAGVMSEENPISHYESNTISDYVSNKKKSLLSI
jgi:hypothetical protein